jgi:hypothetical protein
MKFFVQYLLRLLGLFFIAGFLLGARVCQEDYDFAAQSQRATPTPTPSPTATPTSTPVADDDEEDQDNLEDDEEDQDDEFEQSLKAASKKNQNSFLKALSDLNGLKTGRAGSSVVGQDAVGQENGANWLGQAFVDSDPATCDEFLTSLVYDLEALKVAPKDKLGFFIEWKKAKGLTDDCDQVLLQIVSE